MHRATKLRTVILLAVILSVNTVDVSLAKPKIKKQPPSGTPVLWRKPDDSSTRDLYLGPGGTEMSPDLSQLTFVKEEKGGWSKKYRVRDAAGREWVVKIGKEAQSETSAVRLLWGLGYLTEINYLVPSVTIPGKGTFTNARFEARPEDWKRGEEWKWSQNPFVGTPEFQGLKVMMALLNNWDAKDSNNVIVSQRGNDELRYVISDLGATFGHASTIPFFWRITRSRNNPANYAKSDFLERVKGDRVKLHYGGKNRQMLGDISVRDAEWIGSRLAQLSDRQLGDAFRAANYSTDQINLLTRTVRNRTNELLNVRTQPIGSNR